MSLDKAIISASDKDYKAFDKEVSEVLAGKMKSNLAGFVKYLNKNTFTEEGE